MTDNYAATAFDDDSGIKCNSCLYYNTFEDEDSPCDTCCYIHDEEG